MTREELLTVEADLRRQIRDELEKLYLIEKHPAGLLVPIKDGQVCDAFSFERMHYRPKETVGKERNG